MIALSKRTVETLVDLVEIKLSYIEVTDRDDAIELAQLKRCLMELQSAAKGVAVEAASAPRRGRRPKPRFEDMGIMAHA